MEDWSESTFSLTTALSRVIANEPVSPNLGQNRDIKQQQQKPLQPACQPSKIPGELLADLAHNKSEVRSIPSNADNQVLPSIRHLTSHEGYLSLIHRDEMTYHVWDFGGQQVYYHIHHIFFSNMAIYLLVVDVSRNDYLDRMTFWLHSIRGYSQPDVNNIIIIGTHIDKLAPEETARREKMIIRQIRTLRLKGADVVKIPTSNDVMMVSCKDDVSSNQRLKQHLLDMAERLNRDKLYNARSVVLLDLLTQDLPKNTNGKLTWMSLSDVTKKSAECNMNESEVMAALKWYHELGFVLHWSDNEQLRDRVFLKPEELVNAFRTIISFKYQELIKNHMEEEVIEEVQLQHKKELEEGRISDIILNKIWAEYKEEKGSLRELFVKFGLAVKIGSHLVFPCLVTRAQPSADPMNRYFNNSRFEMDVVVGPLGFTSRLIQHMLTQMSQRWKKIKSEIYRDGAVFVAEGLKLRLTIIKASSVNTAIAEVKVIELRSEPMNQQKFDDVEGQIEIVWAVLRIIEQFMRASRCVIASLTSSCLSCYREEQMEVPMGETYNSNCVCDRPSGNSSICH